MSFWQVLGNLAQGGLVDLAGTAITGGINAAISGANRRHNTAERLAAQQYNTSERVASQDWQESMWNKNNIYNEQMYNKYQSPEAMARQYKEAGLNPTLAVNNSSLGSIGSVSHAPNGSTAQSIQPAYVNNAGIPFLENPMITGSFVNMAAALKSLGEAKKLGIDTKYYEDEWKERIRDMRNKNSAQELINNINAKYLDHRTKLEIDKLLVEIDKDNADIIRIRQMTRNLVNEGRISKAVADHWLETWLNEQNKIKADTVASTAGATASYASANASNAQAENSRAEARLNNAKADIEEITRDIRNFKGSTNSPEYKQMSQYAQAEIRKMIYEIKRAGYEIKIKKNEHTKSGYEVEILRKKASNSASGVEGHIGSVLQGLDFAIEEFMKASDFVFGPAVRAIVPEEYWF